MRNYWRFSYGINFAYHSTRRIPAYFDIIGQFFSFSRNEVLADYVKRELDDWFEYLVGYAPSEYPAITGEAGEGWQTVSPVEAKGIGFYYAEFRCENERGETIAYKKIHLRPRWRGSVIVSVGRQIARQMYRKLKKVAFGKRYTFDLYRWLSG